jgi:predicted nucleic acid-binding protein
MILVDTSVLIDFFRGTMNDGSAKLETVIGSNIPFGISSLVFLEVLQGAGSVREYNLLKTYLSTQRFFNPRDEVESYALAADLYRRCRRKGLTISSTIDCLVAVTAMEHDLHLLHNDNDYRLIQTVAPLKFY